MDISRSEVWISTLLSLASQLPLFLVWLVGFIMAIVRWGRHPRVSGFVLIAVFAAAGTSFGGQIVFRILPQMVEISNLSRVFPLVSGCMSVLHAVSWACMLFAAFGNREPQANASPFGQQYSQPPKQPSIDKTGH